MRAELSSRNQYTPDGRMKWSRVWALLIVPLSTAMLVGFLMSWLYLRGWYFVVLVPLIATAVLTAGVIAGVRASHCRKPYLALAIGLLAGTTSYLSYYYFGMAGTLPPGQPARIEMLPDYIQFRLANDVQNDAARPNQKAKEPDKFINWFTFLYEGLIMIGVAGEIARRYASRAYDPVRAQWMKLETIPQPIGTLAQLEAALANDTIADFCDTHPAYTVPNNVAACRLTLEYTNDDGVSPLDRPIYLSATETPIKTWFASWFSRSNLLQQKEIRSLEALELQPLFPALTTILKAKHSELRSEPSTVAGQALSDVAFAHAPPVSTSAASVATTTTSLATITPIAEDDRLKVTSLKHVLLINVIGGAPLIGIVAGIGLGFAAFKLSEMNLVPLAIIAGVIAAVLILASIYISQACPLTLETLYTVSTLRKGMLRRSGKCVEPNDPEAFPVFLTVRENWLKIKLETSSDAGFAKIDSRNRRLLMECDNERFQIPFDSVVGCSCVPFSMSIDPNTQFWKLSLIVQTAEGQREILFSRANPTWTRKNNRMRQLEAEQLQDELAAAY